MPPAIMSFLPMLTVTTLNSGCKTSRAHFSGVPICIFGPVIKESPGLLGHMIRFEQAINHRIGEAFSGYRYPLVGFWGQLGCKKSLLTAGGGFASLRRSLSGDDDLMVQGMAKHKLRFVWDAGNPVHTKSARSLSHLYRQKRDISRLDSFTMRVENYFMGSGIHCSSLFQSLHC